MKSRVSCSVLYAVCAAGVVVFCLNGASAGTVKYWRGAASSLASAAANWSDSPEPGAEASAAAPADGDTVVLDGFGPTTAQRALQWDLSIIPAAWAQDGYTNVVTFYTGSSGMAYSSGLGHAVCGVTADDGAGNNLELRTTGDMVFRSGVWTVQDNPSFQSTHPAATNGLGISRLLVTVGGDCEIGAGARVDLVGKGYANATCVGCAANGCFAASHGGMGSIVQDRNPSPHSMPSACYGSVRYPASIGASSSYIRGGGNFKLTVNGALTFDGTVCADGQQTSGTHNDNYGSGGGVWITAKSISGTGVISADGGQSTMGNRGYSFGGGGRVAIHLTGEGADFSDFDYLSQVSAYTPSEMISADGGNGSGGTIWLETAADAGRGVLLVDGNGPLRGSKAKNYIPLTSTEIRPENSSLRPKKVLLRNGARLGVASGASLDLTGADIVALPSETYTNMLCVGGGTLTVDPGTYTSILFHAYLGGGTLRVGSGGTGLLRLEKDAKMIVDEPLRVLGSLSFGTGTTLSCSPNSFWTKNYVVAADKNVVRTHVDLDVSGDVTLDAGATANVTGEGYRLAVGPGSTTNGGGGSYGGRGEQPGAGVCYGSFKEPDDWGSSGAKNLGGGRFKLFADGTLTVNGTIDADAANAANSGSGGSVWLRVSKLVGTGSIHANAVNQSGPGGGGRVAIHLTGLESTRADFSGTVAARGGVSKDTVGGAGSVYWSEPSAGGTLVVDNNGAAMTGNGMEVGGITTDDETDNVEVRNGGTIRVCGDAELKVRGDWFGAGGSVAVDASAGVRFVDATRTSHISGDTVFPSFLCEVPDKRFVFAVGADDLLAISPAGHFTLAGESGHEVVLRPAADGTAWRLSLGVGTVTDVRFVDTVWSDASAGQSVAAHNSLGKGQHNVNWSFVNVVAGATNTWTGASGTTAWSDGGNWDLERAPAPTDVIVIPGGKGAYPVLSGAAAVDGLDVKAGGSLSLGEWDLSVGDLGLRVAGTLTCGGGETIAVAGDADFAGATFGAANSVLKFAGEGGQAFNPGGCAFDTVEVANGGDVAFAGVFTARRFVCETAAAKSLVFAAGSLVTVTDLVLNGASGDSRLLSLVSSASGTPWRLKVVNSMRVTGVTVTDSDASAGRTVHALAPATGTRCENWSFGAAAVTWTGGATGDFAVPGNWSSGAVPGVDDAVELSGAVTVTASAEVGVGSLTVGKDAKLVLSAPSEIDGSVEVLNGGTLVLNKPCVIGNALLVRRGGKVTHDANSSPEDVSPNGIDVVTGGNVIIEDEASVDAEGKGWAVNKGYGAARGPNTIDKGSAGSHGGVGSIDSPTLTNWTCYGSVLRPVTFGSGGKGTAGGGRVRIIAGGDLQLDGYVGAKGAGGPSTGFWTGAGGSIWLSAARILGGGEANASGGDVNLGIAGGGGRVALYQTEAEDFSGFTGKAVAYGGRVVSTTTPYDNRKPEGAAGTVYWESAGQEGAGTVVVDNAGGTKHVSMMYPKGNVAILPCAVLGDSPHDLESVTFDIRDKGAVEIEPDTAYMNDFFLSGGARMLLSGHILYLRDRRHRRNRSDWTAGGTITYDGGEIRWSGGLLIMVR